MPNWVEPPLPLAIALTIMSMSTPAFRPSAIASAAAAMLIVTSMLLTSFTRLALPNVPKYMQRSAKPLTTGSIFLAASASPAR